MKTLKTLLMASLAALLFTCGETAMEKQGKGKNESRTPGTGSSGANTASGFNRNTNDRTDNSSNNDVPHQDANETTDIAEEVNTATTPNFDNASNPDGTRATDNIAAPRQEQMYRDLNMTDAQINRYESASRTSMDNWKRDHPKQNMTLQNKQDIERTSLQSVLNDKQFKSYGQWAQANPYQD